MYEKIIDIFEVKLLWLCAEYSKCECLYAYILCGYIRTCIEPFVFWSAALQQENTHAVVFCQHTIRSK